MGRLWLAVVVGLWVSAALTARAQVCGNLPTCDDGNPCTTDTCLLASQTCSHSPAPNGTPCTSPVPCTQGACQFGECTSGAPTVCTPLDICHDAGTCDPATGVCSNPPKPDGASCSDGNICNGEETCRTGVCTPPAPVACDRSAGRAFVPDLAGNDVSVIDLARGVVLSTVSVGQGPWGVAAVGDGSRVWVTNRDGATVSTIGGGGATSAAATIPVGERPLGIAFDPFGGRVYVANFKSDSVSVIEVATNAVVATVAVGRGPAGVAAHPAGGRVYVTNYRGGSVSVLDTATSAVVATVPVGDTPIGVAVDPAGAHAYVTSYSGGSVAVLGTVSNAVLARMRVGRRPVGVAVDPTGAHVYVANSGTAAVSVIDAAAGRVTTEVSVPPFPFGVAVDPSGQRIYVASAGADTLAVIDATTNSAGTGVTVGRTPVSVGQFLALSVGNCPARSLVCDDADPFTTDTCSAAGGCQHVELQGTAAVAAGVAELDAVLRAAPPSAFARPTTARRLASLLQKLQSLLGGSGSSSAAERVLGAMIHILRREPAAGVVGRLIDLARGTQARLR